MISFAIDRGGCEAYIGGAGGKDQLSVTSAVDTMEISTANLFGVL